MTLLQSQQSIYRATREGLFWPRIQETTNGDGAEINELLAQLIDEDFGVGSPEGTLFKWEDLYRLIGTPAYKNSIQLLRLPTVNELRPILDNEGTLTDSTFRVRLVGWIDSSGKPITFPLTLTGGLVEEGGRKTLLSFRSWQAQSAIEFYSDKLPRPSSSEQNRAAWSRIRGVALAAQAELSNYLKNTIVVSAEQLKIDLRKVDFGENRTVEVIPGFNGAPARWLEIFDSNKRVLDRYLVPDGETVTHVLVSAEVKTVLEEIKKMEARRVTNARAEAFVSNPFAALGQDAAAVIDPVQFEGARASAGLTYCRFTPQAARNTVGTVNQVSILIEEATSNLVNSDEYKFGSPTELRRFINKLQARVASGAQRCVWEGYDLEILGDVHDCVTQLGNYLAEWETPAAGIQDQLLDLSQMADRVAGFGIERPYNSPFIARENDSGEWFPDDVVFGISLERDGAPPVSITMNKQSLSEFTQLVADAEAAGLKSIQFDGSQSVITIDEAKEILKEIAGVAPRLPSDSADIREPKPKTNGKVGLVVRSNIIELDHAESRGGALFQYSRDPVLPASLKSDVTLKEHQLEGVAWLQSLWMASPQNCRGAILADDMGLGKTLQLLTVIATALETDPDMDPVLVVAPVSLLENWEEEIKTFFLPASLQVLTLYGESLSEKRLPKQAIPEELKARGIGSLLRDNWLGSSKLVLTTYETLRDLEFSLARQRWSMMICDEAQKIKNPNAMMTRAAKKQNVRFRIACTGTPVENSLVDLWCLFDFVQPGLLGALSHFGSNYRKPIEAETDEEKQKIEELRSIIAPQLLRRIKKDVAKELPKKIEDSACRTLAISDQQRALYSHAVSAFRIDRDSSAPRAGGHLGLLQHLRKICSDPRPLGQIGSEIEPLAKIQEHSPKMKWLLATLEVIKSKDEKVIVFCELRDLQRTLKRCIYESVGVAAEIINGETSASATSSSSRQKKIKAFQAVPGFNVIILSPIAAGMGLNIQQANHVIHFTRHWNPAKEDQATDRAYRIGQKRDVYVYYPVIIAKDFTTFDAKLDLLLDWKRKISDDMLNGAGDLSSADFADLQDVGGVFLIGNEPVLAEDLICLDDRSLEALCAALWRKLGYSTYMTPRTGDGGVDTVAIKGKKGVLIQCKSSSREGQELGWEAVKDVTAGHAGYASRHPGVVFGKVALTNQYFNATAREQAKLNQVELIDRAGLANMLGKVSVMRADLEKFLIQSWSGLE